MKRVLFVLTLLTIVALVPTAGLATAAPNDSHDLRTPRAFTPIPTRGGSEVASWTKSSCTSDSGDTCTCGPGKLCVAGADGCACIRPQQ